jgi:hypothetical protein
MANLSLEGTRRKRRTPELKRKAVQPPHMVHVRSFEPADGDAIAAVILPIQQVKFSVPITLQDQPDLALLRR